MLQVRIAVAFRCEQGDSYLLLILLSLRTKMYSTMKKHTIGDWMKALRPWSFPASAMPIIVTLSYLFWKGAQVDWLIGVWVLITMVLFHAAGNTWSDYFDFKRGVDRNDTFGADTMTTGMFEPKEIKTLASALLVLSCLSGIGIFLMTGATVLWCGIAGAVLVLLYPFLKYNAFGDLDILLTFAFIPVLGVTYAVTGSYDWESVFVIALPVGLITDGILHSNNTRDLEHDGRAGITTMAMCLGKRTSAWFYGFEVLFPYVWVAVCSIKGGMPILTVIVFMTLPVAIACSKTMKNSVEGGSQMIADLDIRTANLQLMFSMLLSLSFVIARFI